MERRRTAQPNQRQKMIEKIRDAKEKEEQRLRQTFMSFYHNNRLEEKEENKEEENENEDSASTRVRTNQETDSYTQPPLWP